MSKCPNQGSPCFCTGECRREDDNDSKSRGLQIKQLRVDAGYTLHELSDLTEFTPLQINIWEWAKEQIPDEAFNTIKAACLPKVMVTKSGVRKGGWLA